MSLREALAMLLRLVQRPQQAAQDKRLARSERVVELMRSVGRSGARRADELQSSGRRGGARLAQR